MKLFVISDSHLCNTNPEKDMVVFGDNWKDHSQKIADSWRSKVEDDDVVLIPGDICWALKLDDGIAELDFFADLPGEKVFVKGNHDYWWQSIKKVRSLAPSRLHFIQHDVTKLGSFEIGGSKLWNFDFIKWGNSISRNIEMDEKATTKPPPDDAWLEKIRNRELNRLKISLSKFTNNISNVRVAMVHFPPVDENGNENEITDLMTKYKVDYCVYGHLHSVVGKPKGSDCKIENTRYILAAADFLNFEVKSI